MALVTLAHSRFVHELRENRNFIAASVAAHAAVLCLAFLLPGFEAPREVTYPVIAAASYGNGGAAEPAAAAEPSVAESQIADVAPPELPAPPPSRPAKPRPAHPQTATVEPPPSPAAPTAPAPDEQVAAVPGPNAAAVGAPLANATGNGAESGSAATGGKELSDDYFDRLRRYLTAYRRYPPDAIKRNEEGTVVVKFEVARDGTVGGVQIQHSSGFPLLDQSVLEMMDKASPVPALPETFTGDRGHIIMPIAFSIGFLDRLF